MYTLNRVQISGKMTSKSDLAPLGVPEHVFLAHYEAYVGHFDSQ